MLYQNTESTLLSSQDGFEIFWQKWIPQSDIRTIIIFIHGLGDHSGRHKKLLEAFDGESTAIYAMDNRGHGRTAGKRGYAESFQVLAGDLGDLIEIVRSENPSIPLFLLAHSTGGLIALQYSLADSKQYNLDGLLLSSPPITTLLTPFQKILKGMGRLLVLCVPRGTVKVDMNPSYFTRNPEIIEAYGTDPLNHNRVGVRIGNDLFASSRRVLAEARNIKIPVYIWHGLEDRLCAAEGSQELYDKVGSLDKNIHFYDDLLHDTLNERGEYTIQLFSDMKAWLKQQSAPVRKKVS